MSFTDQISLTDSASAAIVYDKQSETSNKTIRSVAAQPLDQPWTHTVAHEKSKSGDRVNTMVSTDDTNIDPGDNVTVDNCRMFTKLSYTPGVTTLAQLEDQRARHISFLTEANLVKLANLEK